MSQPQEEALYEQKEWLRVTLSSIGDAVITNLLAIEDITERRRSQARIEESELRYRRLFETARDGILLLDAATGKITDANPYMSELLGYAPEQLRGKELWEIGLLQDKASSQAALRQLQERGYIRYEHLPLETAGGRQVDVEFVSNLYQADHQPVIQCNIRDITERRQLEWCGAGTSLGRAPSPEGRVPGDALP